MSTLARQFQPVGTELPLVALIRIGLAPTVCVAGLLLCMMLYREPLSSRYVLLAIVAFVVSARVFGELPVGNNGSRLPLFFPGRSIVTHWVLVIGCLLFLAFITKMSGLYSRKVVLTWFVATPLALHGAQELACRLLPKLVSSSAAIRSKIIVGANELGRELAKRIAEDPCLGRVQGFFDDRSPDRLGIKAHDLLGGLDQVTDYVKRHAIHVVYITLPMSADPRMRRLLDGLRDTTVSIYFVPNATAFDLIQARVHQVGGIPVIAVCETPFYGLNGALKRAFDLTAASLILLLVWPLMLAIALGVKLSAPGPVLFKQRRYGLDGKEIVVYKFRSMTVCEDGERIDQAKRNDKRVTRFGAFLRRTSLDELPQFLNVLEGTMSIVGPRPHAVAHNEQYRRLIKGYMIRHKVKPGITGWAQINGFRGETETVEKMKQRIEYDLDYLRHWSLSLDFWIVARTVLVLLKDRNAY
jgi:putative colanic acid biosynthesis UDP-glucose lipid carrier transferase